MYIVDNSLSTYAMAAVLTMDYCGFVLPGKVGNNAAEHLASDE